MSENIAGRGRCLLRVGGKKRRRRRKKRARGKGWLAQLLLLSLPIGYLSLFHCGGVVREMEKGQDKRMFLQMEGDMSKE